MPAVGHLGAHPQVQRRLAGRQPDRLAVAVAHRPYEPGAPAVGHCGDQRRGHVSVRAYGWRQVGHLLPLVRAPTRYWRTVRPQSSQRPRAGPPGSMVGADTSRPGGGSGRSRRRDRNLIDRQRLQRTLPARGYLDPSPGRAGRLAQRYPPSRGGCHAVADRPGCDRSSRSSARRRGPGWRGGGRDTRRSDAASCRGRVGRRRLVPALGAQLIATDRVAIVVQP